jgi:nucleoside-diphosphate-sugar epimerase
MKTILLTGSSGYIGRTLAPFLKQKGFAVIGLDRNPCPYTDHQLDAFIQGDLCDDACLKQIPDGINAVYHLAAAKDDWGLSDEEYFDDNVTATRKLLHAGCERGIRQWLFFSSVAVLGSSIAALDESAPMAPKGAYGESKSEGEMLFHHLAEKEPSARILIMRPSFSGRAIHRTQTSTD